jgi:hypothetical protein
MERDGQAAPGQTAPQKPLIRWELPKLEFHLRRLDEINRDRNSSRYGVRRVCYAFGQLNSKVKLANLRGKMMKSCKSNI